MFHACCVKRNAIYAFLFVGVCFCQHPFSAAAAMIGTSLSALRSLVVFPVQRKLRLGWKGGAPLTAKSMFCFLFCIRLSIRLLRTQPLAQVATGLTPSVSSHLSPLLLLHPLGEERKGPCQQRRCGAAAEMVQLWQRSVNQNMGRTCASGRMSRWMRGVESGGWGGGKMFCTQPGTNPLGSSVCLACLPLSHLPFNRMACELPLNA